MVLFCVRMSEISCLCFEIFNGLFFEFSLVEKVSGNLCGSYLVLVGLIRWNLVVGCNCWYKIFIVLCLCRVYIGVSVIGVSW